MAELIYLFNIERVSIYFLKKCFSFVYGLYFQLCVKGKPSSQMVW